MGFKKEHQEQLPLTRRTYSLCSCLFLWEDRMMKRNNLVLFLCPFPQHEGDYQILSQQAVITLTVHKGETNGHKSKSGHKEKTVSNVQGQEVNQS